MAVKIVVYLAALIGLSFLARYKPVFAYLTSSVSVPVWLLWLLCPPALLVLLRLLVWLRIVFGVRGYTDDIFDGFSGVLWRWSYLRFFGSEISLPSPYCPICESQLQWLPSFSEGHHHVQFACYDSDCGFISNYIRSDGGVVHVYQIAGFKAQRKIALRLWRNAKRRMKSRRKALRSRLEG